MRVQAYVGETDDQPEESSTFCHKKKRRGRRRRVVGTRRLRVVSKNIKTGLPIFIFLDTTPIFFAPLHLAREGVFRVVHQMTKTLGADAISAESDRRLLFH